MSMLISEYHLKVCRLCCFWLPGLCGRTGICRRLCPLYIEHNGWTGHGLETLGDLVLVVVVNGWEKSATTSRSVVYSQRVLIKQTSQQFRMTFFFLLLLFSFFLFKFRSYYYWSLLYSAVLRCWAASLRSHVILREWIAFHSAFLNIHRSGVLSALAWLVPQETAAISARSVYTIQPCTMSLHAKPHT